MEAIQGEERRRARSVRCPLVVLWSAWLAVRETVVFCCLVGMLEGVKGFGEGAGYRSVRGRTRG